MFVDHSHMRLGPIRVLIGKQLVIITQIEQALAQIGNDLSGERAILHCG
jgi:hypothetical protein